MDTGETKLTSRQVMARAGISRATLNNYIQLGILPKPELAKYVTAGRRVPRIGHFPRSALAAIEHVKRLKREGFTIAEIASMLTSRKDVEAPIALVSTPNQASPPSLTPVPGSSSEPSGRGLRLTIDHIESPAYLLNAKFELEWANRAAQEQILGIEVKFASDITERNLFNLVFQGGLATAAEGCDDFLRFHLGIAKNRTSRAALLALSPEIGDEAVEKLARLHEEAPVAPMRQIQRAHFNMAPPGAPACAFDVFTSFFREGIFFAFAPAEAANDELMALLSRRDVVIRDLLKRRRPYLTEVAALVADLQDSVKICAELPPEEYFQLINDIWGAMEPRLRKYYATHGKHVGDGMVYYFFPQPDCSYVLNAIRCAHEMQAAMQEISRTWRTRKNWLNELKINIGLHQGQEWFGTYQTPTHIEFTVLGDTINMAARLSDFARQGAIWVSKTMLGQLTSKEREGVQFGIRRKGADGADILVPATYSRIANLVDLNTPKAEKLRDISMLAVTEILDVAPAAAKPAR